MDCSARTVSALNAVTSRISALRASSSGNRCNRFRSKVSRIRCLRSGCTRAFLILLNLSFLVISCVVITLALSLQIKRYQQQHHFYLPFFHPQQSNQPTSPPQPSLAPSSIAGDLIFTPFDHYPILIISTIVFIITFLGCCGACVDSAFFLCLYSLLLCVVFVVEVVFLILACVFSSKLISGLENSLYHQLRHSYNNTALSANATSLEILRITVLIDSIQIKWQCCGAKGSSDYYYSSWFNASKAQKAGEYVPLSCCTPKDLSGGGDEGGGGDYEVENAGWSREVAWKTRYKRDDYNGNIQTRFKHKIENNILEFFEKNSHSTIGFNDVEKNAKPNIINVMGIYIDNTKNKKNKVNFIATNNDNNASHIRINERDGSWKGVTQSERPCRHQTQLIRQRTRQKNDIVSNSKISELKHRSDKKLNAIININGNISNGSNEKQILFSNFCMFSFQKQNNLKIKKKSFFQKRKEFCNLHLKQFNERMRSTTSKSMKRLVRSKKINKNRVINPTDLEEDYIKEKVSEVSKHGSVKTLKNKPQKSTDKTNVKKSLETTNFNLSKKKLKQNDVKIKIQKRQKREHYIARDENACQLKAILAATSKQAPSDELVLKSQGCASKMVAWLRANTISIVFIVILVLLLQVLDLMAACMLLSLVKKKQVECQWNEESDLG